VLFNLIYNELILPSLATLLCYKLLKEIDQSNYLGWLFFKVAEVFGINLRLLANGCRN
jgi:hypothetical protein